MATFYVLPSRQALGQRFGEFLGNLFPGLDLSSEYWYDLAEALGAAARSMPEVYVLFREDLPDGDDLLEGLARDFGVEPDDEVIEVPASFWRDGPRLAA